MATQTLNTKPVTATTAQWAVEADGAFCVLVGLLFLLDANRVSQFMGAQSATVIGALGLGTALYGVVLFYDAFKGLVNGRLLRVLMTLDFIGAAVTIAFLVVAPTTLSTEGRWVTLILADVMAAFGIWKYVGLRRMNR